MIRNLGIFFLLVLFSIEFLGQTIQETITSTKSAFISEQDTPKKAMLAADLAWYYSQVNIDSAEHYGLLSLQLSKSTHDEALIAQSLNDLATVYLIKGSYQASIDLCNEGIEIREKLGDEKGISGLQLKKGNAFNKLALYDSAMHYYFKAHEGYSKIGDSAVFVNIEANISSTYFSMGNLEKAKEYLKLPIEFYRNHQAYYYLANSTLNLASIQLALKDTSNAILSFDAAIQYAESSENGTTLSAAYNNLSNIYMARNNFDLAIENIEKAIEIRTSMGLDADLQSSFLTLANAKLGVGDYSAAKSLFLKTRTAFEQIQAQDKLKEIYLGLSFIYAAEKKWDSLSFYHNKYSVILQQFYDEEHLKLSHEIEVKYQTEKKELALAEAKNKNLANEVKIRQQYFMIIGSLTLAALLALIGYLVYRQQKIKTKQLERENELRKVINATEIQNKLYEQRLEISRELHDNIGSQLTFIISSLDNLSSLRYSTEETQQKLEQLGSFTKTTISEFRDAIWAMNKEAISFEDLKARTYNFIENAQLYSKGIDFVFDSGDPKKVPHLSSSTGINLYRIIQEAVNNAMKHAQPSSIIVSLLVTKDETKLIIRDNGIGIDLQKISNGNGVFSMQKRATEINANLLIKNDDGTIVEVTLSN